MDILDDESNFAQTDRRAHIFRQEPAFKSMYIMVVDVVRAVVMCLFPHRFIITNHSRQTVQALVIISQKHLSNEQGSALFIRYKTKQYYIHLSSK